MKHDYRTTEDLGCYLMANAMPKIRFQAMKKYIADNKSLDNSRVPL